MHKTADGLSAQSTVTLVEIAVKEQQQQTENYRRGLVPLEEKLVQGGDLYIFLLYLYTDFIFK